MTLRLQPNKMIVSTTEAEKIERGSGLKGEK
jgi:hypothetical protein